MSAPPPVVPAEPPLAREEPAERAVRRLLKVELERLRASAARDLLGADPEPLHDARVAVRRARSLVQEMVSVLPPRTAGELARRLQAFGRHTNPRRDLAVSAELLARLFARAPAWVRRHEEAIRGAVGRRGDEAGRELEAAVNSPETGRLLATWERVAERRGARVGLGGEEASLGAVASRRLHKAAERVVRRAAALGPEPSAKALHRLRIACKKLRYLLEFFRSLAPQRTVAALIRSLKDLQDDLGTINDLAVAERLLLELASEAAADRSGPDGLLALGFLLGEIERERALALHRMRPALRAFVSRRNQERLRRLF